jgi:hypothetical protein
LADEASGKLRGFFGSFGSNFNALRFVVKLPIGFVAFVFAEILVTIDKGLLVVISVSQKVFFSSVGRTDFSNLNLSLRDFLGAGCHWKEGRMCDK